MILENVPGCIHGEGHSYRTEAEASLGSHCWRWLLLSGANARPSRSPTQTWLELTGRSLLCCGLVCPWRSGHAAWRLSFTGVDNERCLYLKHPCPTNQHPNNRRQLALLRRKKSSIMSSK